MAEETKDDTPVKPQMKGGNPVSPVRSGSQGGMPALKAGERQDMRGERKKSESDAPPEESPDPKFRIAGLDAEGVPVHLSEEFDSEDEAAQYLEEHGDEIGTDGDTDWHVEPITD